MCETLKATYRYHLTWSWQYLFEEDKSYSHFTELKMAHKSTWIYSHIQLMWCRERTQIRGHHVTDHLLPTASTTSSFGQKQGISKSPQKICVLDWTVFSLCQRNRSSETQLRKEQHSYKAQEITPCHPFNFKTAAKGHSFIHCPTVEINVIKTQEIFVAHVRILGLQVTFTLFKLH